MIELHQILRETLDLEPLGESASKLASLVTTTDVDLDAVVRVVQYDPALSARVLRAANSVKSGSFSEIVTIEGAVVRLGPAWILSMALATSVQEQMEVALPQFGLHEGELWHHSMAAAIAAEELRRFTAVRIPPVAATASLLHDVGKLILARHLRRHLRLGMRRRVREDGLSGLQAEAEVLQIDHAELGGMIARHWELPESIALGIAHHHHPAACKDPGLEILVHTVHVADIAAGLSLDGAERHYLSLEELETSLGVLGMRARRLQELCEVVRRRTDEVLASYV